MHRACAPLLAIVLASTPAWADDRERAAVHFAAAAAAEKRGDWRSAIVEYEQAYAAAPHPSVLFNMANAHEKLDEHRRAAELFRRYLADSPEAEDRGSVQRRIAALRDRRSRLHVVSDPVGATLIVDGQARGTTPIDVDLTAGKHRAHVEQGRDRSETVEVVAEYGEPRELVLSVPSSVTGVTPTPVRPKAAPGELSFGIGIGAHPALGAEWDSRTPVSVTGRVRGGFRLLGRVRLFAELGGAFGPSIEDDRVGIMLGPKEQFLLLAPRAGAAVTVWQLPGRARLDVFAAAGLVFGYHALLFGTETVAKQAVFGAGGGGGVELVYASAAAPRQHWLVSAAWFVLPSAVGDDTGFRSTGTVDLGGFELVLGWAVALGGGP